MFKQIIIDQAHAEKLTEAIKAAEGRATARTITAEDVIKECDRQLVRLYGLGASLDELDGTEIRVDINAQDFPNAYKYIPESTHFCATFSGKKWRLTYVCRNTCRKNRGSVKVPEAAKKSIMATIEDAGAELIGRRDCRGKLRRA